MKFDMKIDKSVLFPIFCWKIRIIDFEKKKKELIEILEPYPEKRQGIQDFATNKQTNRDGLIEKFLSIMKQELEDFSKEIKKDIAITEVWSVSYDKEDSQLPHNHGSMGLTAILYLNLPKDSPKTEYIQPWNDENDLCYHNAPDVVEGDMIIVPSFLLHFSKPNKSNSKKRVISWDMKIIRDADRGFSHNYENSHSDVALWRKKK